MSQVIDIDGGDYDTATESLAEANRLSAATYGLLTDALGASAGMAGDDASSRDFAEQYDTAARDAVAAYAELVEALGTVAELSAASADNHRRAELASVYGAASTPVSDAAVAAVTVSAYSPPSALGGNADSTPDGWDLVVDELQGLAWPNADTGRLRSAAAVWRDAAGDVVSLGDYCRAALDGFARLRSPEIPIAEEAVAELGATADELAVALTDLAEACDEYAAQVEAHRDIVKGILRDLVIELGIAVIGGIITGIVSAGAGTALGAGAAALRIRSAATKIVAALTALREAAKGVAVARLSAAVSRVRPLRRTLQKFRDARRIRRNADSVDDWRHLPPKIPYTWDETVQYRTGPRTPMEHIKEAHWPDSTLPRKGHFAEGITEESVRDYVARTMREGKPPGQDPGTYQFAFDEPIGTDIDGNLTNILRVHVRDGVVNSAYPYPAPS